MSQNSEDNDELGMTLELIGNSRDLNKAVDSDQISERVSSWDHDGAITPPYNPSQLASLQEISGTHGISITKKSKREVGHGFKIVPHENVEDPDEEELDIVEYFWRGRDTQWWIGIQSKIPATPTEIFELARRDYHGIGWLSIELIYNDMDDLVGMSYCPAESIRLRKDKQSEGVEIKHGFIQKKGNKTTFFAEAGARKDDDPTYVDANTGEIADSKEAIGKVANELLYIPNPSGLTDFYGIPPWVAEIQTIMMDRKARTFNYNFFEYDALPQLAIIVQGGRLSKQSKEQLTNMIQDLREKEGRRVPVLEAENLKERGLDIDSEIEIELKEMGKIGDQDLSFGELRRLNEHDIAKAHEIPQVLVNRLESANRANSREQIRDFTADVIKPNQNRFANRLYRIIHQRILDVYDWTIEFITKGGEDELRDAEIAETKIQALQGVLKVDEARDLMELEPLDDEIGDMYLAEVSELLSPAQEMSRNISEMIQESAEDLREELEIEQAIANADE